MYSLPFDLDLGMTTVKGLLHLKDETLCVEWRVYDLFGAPRGNLEEVNIPLDAILEISYRERLTSTKVAIRCSSARLLEAFPLPSGDITTLVARVKRRFRSDARLWVAEAELRIAGNETQSQIS